jgi:tripartite-type tricarboxylate transporter receptor subunit TctC
MLHRVVHTAFLLVAMQSCWLPTSAVAQGFPQRPITLVVTFPPGGSADIVARALEPKVSAQLGQSLVIENRPGAGGNIGIGAVAKAEPDGYTLGIAAAGVLAVNPHLNRSMPFDPKKDLAPITLLAQIPFVLVAGPRTTISTVAESLAMARASPDAISIGHGGNGTAMHLTAALFAQKAAINVPLVPYRGTAPAANDVLGGHIALAVLDIPASLQLIREGKLKALGISAKSRFPKLAEVPTLAEAGLPDYESVGWFGLVAPRNTPPDIIARLHAAFSSALRDPQVIEKIGVLGAEPAPSSPEGFAAYIDSEGEKWGKLVNAVGLKADN